MVTVEPSAELAGESGAESRDDAGSLSRFDLRKLILLEPTHDPELDPSQVPPMATARLSLFVAHPILYGGVCAHIAEQVETRLTVAASAHDSDKNAAHQGGFAPRPWIKHMVSTIAEWPIEKRLAMLIFIDYLTSFPTRATHGKLSMKSAFLADGRAEFWPETDALPQDLQYASASSMEDYCRRQRVLIHFLIFPLCPVYLGSTLLDLLGHASSMRRYHPQQ